MTKPRRKSEIRAQAAAGPEALRRAAERRTVFRQPIPQSWHDVFLRALKTGLSIEEAAKRAGVTRTGVRWARLHDDRFYDAFLDAYRICRRARYSKGDAHFATNRSTTEWGY